MNGTPQTYGSSRFFDRTFRLGGFAELDGRVSWAPHLPGRVQPVNSYLLFEDDVPYMIDTGLAAHRDAIRRQVAELVDARSSISLLITRGEYQNIGNMGAIHSVRRFGQMYFFGRNPFAAYEDISRSAGEDVKATVLDASSDVSVSLAGSRYIRVISTLIRVLGTFWAYDSRSRTVFTSDWFGHTSTPASDPVAVLDDDALDETTYESARQHVLKRYFWLPMANTRPMERWLERFFADHPVDNIAPTFGCVLSGRKTVEKHYSIAMDILRRRAG